MKSRFIKQLEQGRARKKGKVLPDIHAAAAAAPPGGKEVSITPFIQTNQAADWPATMLARSEDNRSPKVVAPLFSSFSSSPVSSS